MSKVDNCGHGMEYLSYSRVSGRPQTVPFLSDSLQLLDNAIARNGSEMGKSHPILWYRVMNLVLHSNFDFCIFYILIYF